VSEEWRETLTGRILPWVLGDRSLGDDVLEIGPGPGLTTDVLRERAARVTAVELDDDLAAGLASRLAGTNVEVVHADATDLPLPDDRFSAAACLTMLHHVPTAAQQDQLLREACRVLRPGGVLVGSDSVDSPRVRAGHADDVFNPVDATTFADRLLAAGFAAADVEVDPESSRLRFAATKAG
jgi:SAM-dependent methyltransferase